MKIRNSTTSLYLTSFSLGTSSHTRDNPTVRLDGAASWTEDPSLAAEFTHTDASVTSLIIDLIYKSTVAEIID